MTDPIDRLEAELAALAGPTARLHAIADFRLELESWDRRFDLVRADVIHEARTAGLMTWRAIGEVLGVSLQRAHELGTAHHPSTHHNPTERTRT